MGAVVFSTGAIEVRRLAGIVVGFSLTAWLLRGGNVPDPAAVAGFVALVASAKLYRPAWMTLPAFCGGVLAASLGSYIASHGVLAPAAFGGAALIPVFTLVLSRHKDFASEATLEEGVLLVLALGLGAAVGPAIIDGWQSAGSLNQAAEAASHAMPVWVVSAVGTSLFIGGLWSLWRHR